MKRGPSPIELLLVALLVFGVLLHIVFRPDYSKRNYEFFPDMAETPGYEAQDPNAEFADGKTLQTPAVGTVARGYIPMMDAAGELDTTTEWEKMAAGERSRWDALKAPWLFDKLEKADQAGFMARGKHVFENVCATCHGLTGTGGTPVTKRGVPPPPRLMDPKYAAYTDGHLYHVITLGKGNMAAHGNTVERDDRWKLIRYVRTLLSAKP